MEYQIHLDILMHEEKHQSTDQQSSDKKIAEVPEMYAKGAKTSMIKFQGARNYKHGFIEAVLSKHMYLGIFFI